jgi:hypothetical protein
VPGHGITDPDLPGLGPLTLTLGLVMAGLIIIRGIFGEGRAVGGTLGCTGASKRYVPSRFAGCGVADADADGRRMRSGAGHPFR